MSRYSTYLDLMEQANRSNIGYDQGERWSWLDKPGKRIVPNTEADCSAMTIGLAWLAGYDVPTENIKTALTCYTGNAIYLMHDRAGWPIKDVRGWSAAAIQNIALPGDMVLSGGHIQCMARDRRWWSVNHDENFGARGGKAGEQHPNESSMKALTGNGWLYLIMCPDARNGSASTAQAAPAVNPAKLQTMTLSKDAAKRLQFVLNKQDNAGLVEDGIVGKLTISALQKRLKCPVDGELWTPSAVLKAQQKYLNGIRAHIIKNLKKPSPWEDLAEDGVWGPRSQYATEQYLTKWNGHFS